jgi:hypothetical protein
MRSDLRRARVAPVAITNKDRAALARMLAGSLQPGETIVATLPYAHTPKRPKTTPGRKGRVRVGIYQTYRRYRPLVLTSMRLFVFETGRTPYARDVLAEFPNDDVEVVQVTTGSFGATRVVLELPGVGQVPFETGRREQEDTAILIEALGGPPSGGC